MKFSRKYLILIITTFLAVVTISSCGDEKRLGFPELIDLIEEGENRIESGNDIYLPKMESMIKCLQSADYYYECELQRADLKESFNEVLEQWDFQTLKAELLAIRLADDHPDALVARDVFVQHLDVWRELLIELSVKLPTQAQVSSSSGANYLSDWWELGTSNDSSLSQEINTTFDKLCGALGNSQPRDTDEYKARIVDICDD